MTTKQSIKNRITSLLLVFALLFSMLPILSEKAYAASVNGDRLADPSTMDSWRDLFPITGEISTENAGGVWMDKSVFTDGLAFAGTGITQDDPDSFLVALSAMAANMSITGMSNVPTDTMLVLDVSGSMNDNSGNNDVAQELVEAANGSIATLLATNKYNRVGVVLYSGPTTQGGATTAGDAILILPLDRYTTGEDGEYLNYNVVTSGGRNPSTTEYVALDPDVRTEQANRQPTYQQKEVVGGTYLQKGINLAMNQFIAESNSTTVEDPVMGVLPRKPIMVLMSDGAPTVGSTAFTAPNAIQLGDGTATSAALGFVSQLSAAYAKAMIEDKYGCDSLFYTLGLGLESDSIGIGVLDPANANASTALGDLWTRYQALDITDASTNNDSLTVQAASGNRPARTVAKIATALDEHYVDQYFAADGTGGSLADDLKLAFQDIVNAIQLQSSYFPTLISESEDLSGYISFVDRIGEYMEVIDVKGILIDDQLFSGADLASNFVAGGGKLGTFDAPTALGVEMVAAVRARLGLDSDDTARTLISLAYENGQLSYTDAENYSNYIGWYANAAGQFLGFYHEGVTVLPEATGDAAADPAFLIRSYGYLGAVDESHGVSESDMMYATVQVRTNIATGEQLVTFAIPAALIPVVSYNVTLDENAQLSDLTVDGAEHPIRLVYEVALDPQINSFNLLEKVSAEYLAGEHNQNADGSVNFYTNQWDHVNATGYGTVNTYSYFNPSRQNEKYYYLEDAPVYADANGTLYTGDAQPSGTAFRAYKVYKNNGSLRTETVYRPLSDAAKATAVRAEDGTWYVPKGNVHVNMDGYTVHKSENLTGTLSEVSIPFVDTYNHTVNDTGYQFYVGATLGNNGKLTVRPETGIRLTKTMAADAAAPSGAFTFTLTNISNPTDSTQYPAWLIRADGTEADMTVQFESGAAAVELSPGDVLYIGGMTANDTFRIVEKETVEYVATATGVSATGTLTVVENTILPVDFVNADRGTGNLTIAKEVEHDFGVEYQIPADKVFTMEVTLSGIGTANATFRAEHTDGTYTQITTDENGKFTVRLKHDEQFEIFGLPAGITAMVAEIDYGTGFGPAYWDNGQPGDGNVTVAKDFTASVIVVNDYQAAEVYPVFINVSGNKTLLGRDWDVNDSFQFQLQKLLPDGTWQQLGENAEAVADSTGFEFADAFQDERYTQIGTYYYRIIEIEPAAPLGGVSYDKTVHSFAVVVTDSDMDGQLEISEVKTDRPGTTEVTKTASGWDVFASFTNTYSATGSATVTIDVNKVIDNNGGAAKSLAGFTFGLFDAATGTQVGELLTTTERGFARFVLNYDAADVGQTYTYILKEILPDPIPNGWTYSTQEIPVTVRVTDNGDGTLSAVIFTGSQESADAGTSIVTTFTNNYDPEDTELPIDFVSKVLTGRAMNPGEFTFAVRTTDDPAVTVLTGTNDADGKVTFDGALEYDRIGTYIYDIVETGAGGNGVVTDQTAHRVIVTVTDVDGKLHASYVLVTATGDTVTFHNTYTADPVDHIIDGTKALRGRSLLNDEFTFVLTELTMDGMEIANPASWSVKNFADGTFAFPAITYLKAGTYTYSVAEQTPDGGSAYGILYDNTQYKVTVVVKDDGLGSLYIASETLTLMNGNPASALAFVNDYVPKGTSAQFAGEKQLTGKVNNALAGGEFEFELYNSNANWERLDRRETVANGAGGIITFTQIDFDTDEDQYFIVVEKNGGQTIDGITYDDTVYRVWVEVTDDLKGQLHAKVHIFDGAGIPQDKIFFVNVYEITGNETVTLSGEKILDGRELLDGDSFTFELYEADAYFNAAEFPKLTVDMDPDTHKYQMELNYTAENVGKTFHYVLKEKNAGQTIDGITYSQVEYHITVLVEDDGKGGIKTTVTVENATTSTLNFVNEYKTGTASVTLGGTKELTGKTLEDNAFTFDLIESNASWTVGNTLQTVKNISGKIDFASITYTQPGDYYYLIVERDGGKTIDGVTYDGTVYRVHVKATDNLDGTLTTETTITDATGAEKAIAFVNVYTVTGTASVELSGEKTLNGREWNENDSFVFELYAEQGTSPIATAEADVATGRFNLGITYTAADVGKTFHYVLKEKNAGQTIDGITYSQVEYHITVLVEDDGKGGIKTTVTVENATTSTLNFVNEYKTGTASVTLGGTKELTGKTLEDNAFTFDLIESNASWTVGNTLQTVKNISGKIDFASITYTQPGDYYYLIVERDGGKTIDGVTYDGTVYRVHVKATDNLDGTLTTETTITDATGAEKAIAFVNVYTVTGTASVELSGEKTLNGREWNENDSFVFELYAEQGTSPIATAEADAATGRFNLGITYTAADVGKTFRYVLKEKNAGQTIDGITYSAMEYHITVEVVDNGDGTILVEATVENATTSTLNFVNEYAWENVFLHIDGTKTLHGIRALNADDFLFELYAAAEDFSIDGAAIQAVRNLSDGSFAFADVEFTEAGIYRFVVLENSQNPIGGVTYDDSRYHITVEVVDNGVGKLTITQVAMVKVNGETTEEAEAIAFVNHYNAESAVVTIGGSKILTGRELAQGEFRFLMYATNEIFEIPEGAEAMEAYNAADGTFTFQQLTFDQVGTYYFAILEDSAVEAERITFDNAVYLVTVEVTDNGNGKLIAAEPVIVKAGTDVAAEAVEFANVYTPKPEDITLNIHIHKTVVNKGTAAIGPEDFEFLLESVADEATRLTATSDAEGLAEFSLTFTEADIGKIYTFKLTEVNSGSENVQYSEAEYIIVISVTLDPETNTLVAEILVNEAETEEIVAEFENIYEYTPPKNDNPKTGDASNMALWMAAAFSTGGAALMLLALDEKRRKHA